MKRWRAPNSSPVTGSKEVLPDDLSSARERGQIPGSLEDIFNLIARVALPDLLSRQLPHAKGNRCSALEVPRNVIYC